MTAPAVILFDLGGVLIELPPMSTMMSESPLSEAEIRQRWRHSSAVRGFESGRIDANAFAASMVEEFEIDTSPATFLERFTAWPSGLMPGAFDLLTSVIDSHHVACLSNTNALHWKRFETELDLPRVFHSTFASHQVGMMKPDAEIFAHVIDELGVAADRIAFFDDSQPNVDAARAVGMQAFRALGPSEVSRHLGSLTR